MRSRSSKRLGASIPALVAALSPVAVADLGGSGPVQAKLTPLVGCTQPAPPDSLVGVELAGPVWGDSPTPFLVSIEVEEHPPAGQWVAETSATGFSGASYYRWDGPDHFGSPGNGTMTYKFKLPCAGEWQMRILNRHDHPDPSLENDCWVKVDDGEWDKLFNNEGLNSVGKWNWTCKLDSTTIKPKYNLSEGEHTLLISGRSHNFKIDRIHFFQSSQVFGETKSHPVSDRCVETPVIGGSMRLEQDDPTNAAGITPGAVAALFVGGATTNHPCGFVLPGIGELFFKLPLPKPQLLSTKIWNGPGSPVVHNVNLPNEPSIVGLIANAQGFFIDLGTSVVTATDGAELLIGEF